jgi:DNA-directed RNA polymerase subunit M/transcription elongation factor TFIIS
MAANCPECDSEIDLDEMDVDVGDELSCSECGALIRVASESPLELELADEDEDLDDDDEEDEDEDEDEDDEGDEEEEDEDDGGGWRDDSDE